jgi:hypothetical protein
MLLQIASPAPIHDSIPIAQRKQEQPRRVTQWQIQVQEERQESRRAATAKGTVERGSRLRIGLRSHDHLAAQQRLTKLFATQVSPSLTGVARFVFRQLESIALDCLEQAIIRGERRYRPFVFLSNEPGADLLDPLLSLDQTAIAPGHLVREMGDRRLGLLLWAFRPEQLGEGSPHGHASFSAGLRSSIHSIRVERMQLAQIHAQEHFSSGLLFPIAHHEGIENSTSPRVDFHNIDRPPSE